tara:strand:- start:3820 stop:4011 length:192 start_codon:yes stop_codon:yes gene_type:complete
MANAKLHMICGNCGCSDLFEYQVDPQGHDVTDDEIKFLPAVWISCKNCSTVHDLDKNATANAG